MEFHVVSNGCQPLNTILHTLPRIEPFIHSFHLREKNRNTGELGLWLQQMKSTGFPLEKVTMNSHVDLANAYGTGGVHLPENQSDQLKDIKQRYPNLRVGCSVHSLNTAKNKAIEGVDYLLYGHVFPTTSKRHQQPRGIVNLENICSKIDSPVIAIGGINANNLAQIKSSGASGFAMMSGIMESENPREKAKQIYETVRGLL